MVRGRYPDWVHRFVGANQKAKRVSDGYYLYSLENGREVYLGVITQEGVRYKEKERVHFGSWNVYEYGASRTLLELCPEEWKSARGKMWREDLRYIISKVSPSSYYLANGLPKEHGNMHLAKKRLDLFLRKRLATSIDEVFARLGNVMILINETTGEKTLSGASAEVFAFVAKLNIKLEELL